MKHGNYRSTAYRCSDGTYVRSQLERQVWEDLLSRGVGAKYEPKAWKYQVIETRKYTPDLVLPDGSWVEIKGYFPPPDRAKMRHIRKAFPTQTIRLLFHKDNWLNKNCKTRYSEWARQRGFDWHIGTSIPPHWT